MIHLQRNQLLDLRNQKLKTVPDSQILSKGVSSFFRCYSHIVTIANQLPGFPINRSTDVEEFFNVNIFF